MTDLAYALWLSDLCGSVATVLILGGIGIGLSAACIRGGILIYNSDIDKEDDKAQMPSFCRWGLVVAPALIFLGALLPERATVKQMIAATYAEQVLTSKAVVDIANPAAMLMKEYIEAELKRLRSSGK